MFEEIANCRDRTGSLCIEVIGGQVNGLLFQGDNTAPGRGIAEVNRGANFFRSILSILNRGICIVFVRGVDVVLVRVIMLVALLAGTSGFWIYLILWIAVPKAETAAQKCELRGMAPTAENLAKFSNYSK